MKAASQGNGDLRHVDRIPVDQLLLDKENPRLASSELNEASPEDLVKVLWRDMAVDEVALSIAHNGYYADEPLLVIPEQHRGQPTGKFIVLEGNRRLAAVLLLRDANLRQRVRATELPQLSPGDLRRLDTLPVSIHPDRKSLWAYLGFRHVNGTKPWDAFSKAKYVAHVHESLKQPLDEIAARIGDRHATVRRLYYGYLVLRQAETFAGFDAEDRVKNRFHFSHLYTALDYPEVQTFLGITDSRWKTREPVPRSKTAELADLMKWLYGKQSQGTQPLIRTQNPDLTRLRNVLRSPGAVALLRKGYPLERAFDESVGDKRRFREALSAAKQELQKAKATVTTGYSGEDDLFETMEAVAATSNSIYDEMSRRRETAAKRRKAS